MFKNLVAMPEIVEYRTIIAQRRATSLDSCNIADAYTIFSHVLTCMAFSRCCAMVVRRFTTSYDIAQPSYDFNRVHTMTSVFSFSADNHSDFVRLSYDGRAMSYVLFPYDYLRACDCPKCVASPSCQCDRKNKTKIL